MKHPKYSLDDSEQYQLLADITLKHGREGQVDDLKELIYLLLAPPNLHRFLYLCKVRIPEILTLLNDIEQSISDSSGTDDSINGLDIHLLNGPRRWLSWYEENFSLFLGRNLPPDEKSLMREMLEVPEEEIHTNSLKGWGLERYSLYGGLVERPKSPEAFRGWGGTLLLMWLAQAKVMASDKFSRDDYFAYSDDKVFTAGPYDTYNANRLLRPLSSESYEPLAVSIAESDSIWRGLLEVAEHNDTFKPLVNYIRNSASGKWRIHNRTGKHGTGSKSKRLPPGYIDLRDGVGLFDSGFDDEESDGSILEVIENPFDPKKTQKIVDTGLDPREFRGGDVLTLAKTPCETTNKNIMAHELAARRRQQQIRMQNQLLPWQANQLTLGEATDLYCHLRAQCEDMTSERLADPGTCRHYELTLMVLLMFCTGSGIERVKELGIVRKGSKTTSESTFLYQHADERAGEGNIIFEWGMSAYMPTYATEEPEIGLSGEEEGDKEKTNNFFLPDILNVAPLVMQYREKAVLVNRKLQSVFQGDFEDYEKAIKNYIRAIPDDISDRLTVGRISKYLFHQITSETNDVTAAACITAQAHHLAGTRIHYTVLDINYLRGIVLKALTPLLRNMGLSPDEVVIIDSSKPAYVGARHCVQKGAYRKAVRNVIADLRKVKKLKGLDALIDYHNLYTAYTVWMFNFGVCGRGINNPLISSKEFDSQSGISTYRDKDFEQPYHARLMWLPGELKWQLLNYEEHLSAMRGILWLYLGTDEQPKETSTGFFLKRNARGVGLRYEEITRVNMREHLYAKYLDAPHNSHRRFIRSELVEMGHPTESIDALMGHWFSGEEPWSYFSSFDFGKHIDLLKGSLVPLMRDLGFKSIKSALLKGKI